MKKAHSPEVQRRVKARLGLNGLLKRLERLDEDMIEEEITRLENRLAGLRGTLKIARQLRDQFAGTAAPAPAEAAGESPEPESPAAKVFLHPADQIAQYLARANRPQSALSIAQDLQLTLPVVKEELRCDPRFFETKPNHWTLSDPDA